MMERWKEYKASEFCESVTDGTHDSPKPKDKGFYLITSKHLKDSYIDFASAKLISREDYQKIIQRSKVEQYDVLFSMIGTIGNTLRVTSPQIEFAVKNMGIFKFGGNNLNSKWFYYWLKSPKAKEYIKTRLSGSTQSYLTLNSLREFPVLCPDIETQKDIVNILSSFDDKIELNRRINENLEQESQALFKSWFVDFEPFKDGKFVDSELGKIPEGWKVGTFSEIINSTLSGDWGKEYQQGNYIKKVFCIRGADIPDIKKGNRGNMPTRYILEKNFQSKVLASGDAVIEISGGSPTQSTGRVCRVSDGLLDKYNHSIVCTNFCRAIKPLLHYSSFLYYMWDMLYKKGVMFSYENGTTGIKNLDINGLIQKESIIIPPIEIALEFEKLTQIFYDKIQFNGVESERLSQLRDTLLPRLMSGELKIYDIDSKNLKK